MGRISHLSVLAVIVTLTASSVVKSPSDGNFELLILHNNDMHARFEQTSQLSGTCTTADRDAGKCYGGFPRVATVVKEARAAAASGEGPPVLYLNAGDTYTGTAWFTLYKWKVAAEFLNALQPDAVSLGNHELDEGVEGLIPFIRNLTTPVLAANLILKEVPELEHIPNLLSSVILTIKRRKIGIIGYLTPETKFLAPSNSIEYEDEIVAIRREVFKLKSQGVHIIIALGHSGFLKDLEIAKEVDEVDLVIGGHTNTFLWNSNKTDEIPEVPQGPYPTTVMQESGRPVLVVQSYAYTKYLGKLHLIFDDKGEILKYDGDNVLLNQAISRDPEVLKLVDKYRSNIDRINNVVVGSSSVFLDGEQCRLRECNLGNFISETIISHTKQYFSDKNAEVNIAVIQGGRIRTSLNRPEKPFELTRGDWMTVIPFTDSLTIVTMNGTILLKALEHSVESWRIMDAPGQFLQFSGMKVIYDLAKPPGSRVEKALAMCSSCTEPTDIRSDYEYKVIMPGFLANRGDGYTMFDELPKEVVPYNEIVCILDYVAKHSPINPTEDGRIKLLNENEVEVIPDSIKNSVNINTNRLLPSSSINVQFNAQLLYFASFILMLL